MTIQELNDTTDFLRRVEKDRANKCFSFRKIKYIQVTIADNNYNNPEQTGRLNNFIIQAIMASENDIIEEALRLEEANYQAVLKRAKEYCMEFATGMKVTI